MDQKDTEGKMLALTDGRDDESTARSSYVMMPSDRKAVADTRSSASQSDIQIADSKAAFQRKTWLGLWWDAKGIFNSSDKKAVTDHMEKHRKFYEAVVTFTVMVEKGDAGSYRSLLDLYEDLSRMENEAKRDADSKAICRMLRQFLNDKYKLDHNLKRVECVVLRQKIDDVERACDRSSRAFGEMSDHVRGLRDELGGTKELLRKQQERAERLEAENESCRSMLDTVQNRMEQICLDAEKRSEEANRRSEARIQEMAEQNQREFQKMMKKMMASMSKGSGSNKDTPPFP